ncbi:MAG TPA: cyanophycin synthetase [Myxococcota bacterium]|nr:cyanophycin synthetase [Myxococcota bacterium]HQK50944.1 cyanophycin synthetase [Myxococcota bacterium]
MTVERIRALHGPNIWSRHPVIEAMVTLDPQELPGGDASAMNEHGRDLLAALEGTNGGTILPRTPAHLLGRIALGLMVRAGCPVSFCKVVPARPDRTFRVVVEYVDEEVGRLAMDLAQKACRECASGGFLDVTMLVDEVRSLDEEVRLGPSTGAIVRAARKRGIPVQRLTRGSLVRLGWGVRQRRILAAETDHTPAIAEGIAQDKQLTKDLLAAGGVPVPEGRSVESPEEAWHAALEVGFPVVVKPRNGNQGKGVSVNLSRREQVEEAFRVARAFDDTVLVERYVHGHDYRLLVVGDRMVAAARRDAPVAVGDGVRSVRALVEKINADPRRSEGHATSLSKVRLDDIALALLSQQGLTPDSVPEPGQEVLLRRNANLSTGGTATDVTEEVHPDVATQAVEAAHMIGLDICGVDIIAPRIDRPLQETRGAVVEVNAAPGLRMHLDPSYGKGRPVGEAIVSLLFGPGDDGRIPVVAVSGTNGKTTTVRLVTHILSAMGRTVGMTCSDGISIGARLIERGDCSGPRSARNVLSHPDVEAAVLETARGGILREGLGFDFCDVAVVTNVGQGDHLGLAFIDSVEDLAVVKRVIVQAVAPHGTAVLNAMDPLVVRMADACRGSVLYFATDPANPVLQRHRARDGRALFRDGDSLRAVRGDDDEIEVPLSRIPLTREGRLPFQVENAMAAIGACWALGVPWEVILQGLATFQSTPAMTPGRFNWMEWNGATVIADYGHNPDAIEALTRAIANLPAGKRVVVISAAGDRRDVDIVRQGQIIGAFFDEVVLYQDRCQRGRADGEVIALLRQGLQGAPRARVVAEVRGEFQAIDTGLSRLGSGDVGLILIDQVEESLAYLQQKLQGTGTAPVRPKVPPE